MNYRKDFVKRHLQATLLLAAQMLLGIAWGAAPIIEPVEFGVSGTLTPGAWSYYQVEIPNGAPVTAAGWRIVLSSSAGSDADLYLRRGALPTEFESDRISTSRSIDTIALSDAEVLPGSYFIGVHSPGNQAGEAHYRLSGEIGYLKVLEWDPGQSDDGTKVFTNKSHSGGDYFFKITIPQAPTYGAWRTVLKVARGEADLALGPGPFGDFFPRFESARPGSDGLVVHDSAFQVGQEWLIAVHALPDAEWSLVSGDVVITEIPRVAPDASSGSGPATIGIEGVRYFKTTVPPETLAWRLWLEGATERILLKKGSAPVPGSEFPLSYDLASDGQMLVVPDYLNADNYQGFYFIGIAGNPGDSFQLDSRQQPVFELNYDSTIHTGVNGFGFVTYRVHVPVSQIAWQVSLTPVAGTNPKVAIRRNKVPNAGNNDAFSEASGDAVESVTLTPPVLTDGIFYITVYGTTPFNYDLQNGPPVITPISYLGNTANDDPKRVGWRFYVVNNIQEQLGNLGWYLALERGQPGTQVAIRRNAVPGRWIYRAGESTELEGGGYYDLIGNSFLQQPGHPADIWYVGVYNPHEPLGLFGLRRSPLTAQTLDYNGGSVANPNLAAPRLDYYAVAIPENTSSWKIKLSSITGDAFLLARKGALPPLRQEAGNSVDSPLGQLMAKKGDEYLTILPSSGENQIPQGTYYLAVGSDTPTSSYRLESLGAVAAGQLGPVGAGGIAQAGTAEEGDIRVYNFEVLPGAPNITLWLEAADGLVGMAVRKGSNIPTSTDMSYGLDGGYGGTWSDRSIISIPNPEPGIYSVTVQALVNPSGPAQTRFTLRLSAGGYGDLAFDGGKIPVVGQPSRTWAYFKVSQVPTNGLGWDLRVNDVQGGSPQLFVRRGQLPEFNAPGVYSASTSWPQGSQWDANQYLLLNDSEYSARVIIVGMGNPLQPNTGESDSYYVGVYNAGENTATYSLESRGIGEGFTIPVRDLNYADDAAEIGRLPRGEAAYFRVNIVGGGEVPPKVTWHATLATHDGDAMLFVQKDIIPGIGANEDHQATYLNGGAKLQRQGNEYYNLLPPSGQSHLAYGRYYLAVIGESGGADSTSTATLNSLGSIAVRNLGLIGAGGLALADTVAGGNVRTYQFSLPPNAESVEVQLQDRVGNPVMHLRKGEALPAGANSTTEIGGYGGEGGEYDGRTDREIITVPNPGGGVYSLIIKGGPPYDDASFTLKIRLLETDSLNIDASVRVAEQMPGTWRYFRLNVPSDALGWEIRTRDIAGSENYRPRLIVRRGFLPDFFDNSISYIYGGSQTWPVGSQWAGSIDWTGDWSNADEKPELAEMLSMGRGPLETGTYFVGVLNSSDQPFSYTLSSRGIGTGVGLPVTGLPHNGGLIAIPSLIPREADYYKVHLPAGTHRWEVRLSTTRGDALLLARKDGLPNIEAGDQLSVYDARGKKMQKSGPERFYLLPETGDTLPEGDYYLEVVSEGVNPQNGQIGQDTSSYAIESLGEPPIERWDTIGADGYTVSTTLEGGQYKVWEFTIAPGVLSFQVHLTTSSGAAAMGLIAGDSYPNPTSGDFGYYGVDGGAYGMGASRDFITVASPTAGIYRLALKGIPDPTGYPDSTVTLNVRQTGVTEMSFTPALNTPAVKNTVTGLLQNQETVFYNLTVPQTVNGSPVIGWRLRLSQTIGLAQVRLRKGSLPSDNDGETSSYDSGTIVLAPPYLEPGVWYLEVRALGNTEFSLSSENVQLALPTAAMPANETRGSAPVPFFDTGSQGIDLGHGDWHFYAIDVPADRFLLRVQLEAISGSPNLYARVGAVPTANNIQFAAFEYLIAGIATEYANIVPDSRTSFPLLKPGRWYFAVNADGTSNVRYRLKLSIGWIQELDLQQGRLENQVLAAGDWLYYRVRLPESAPLEWPISFTQISGDVELHIRDGIPPGDGSGNYLKDWASDYQFTDPFERYLSFDQPGTHTLTTPPLRPGQSYYLGFRAKSDAVFSVQSQTGPETLRLDGIIPFYHGSATNNVPAHSAALYRIDVPIEGVRWISQAFHSDQLKIYLRQGTIPAPPVANWSSTSADSSLNQQLFESGWPWVSGFPYFLLVLNDTGSIQHFGIQMDGRNASTDDDDGNGLADAWENQHFGHTRVDPEADPDRDGWTNLEEYLNGTDPLLKDPAPALSLRPLELLPTGQIRIEITGPSKLLMLLQYSDDLNNWSTIQRVTNLPGVVTFDNPPTTTTGRFFRLISP